MFQKSVHTWSSYGKCNHKGMYVFEKLIHFNDNSKQLHHDAAKHDRLYKIRLVVKILQVRFHKVPTESSLY